MPILSVPIQEIDAHIIDPLTYQVIDMTLDHLSLSHVLDRDDIQVLSDRRRSSQTKLSSGEANLRSGRSTMTVQVRTITNPAQLKWDVTPTPMIHAHGYSATYAKDQLSLFADAISGIRVDEGDVPINVVLEFTIHLPDLEQARIVESALTNRYYKDQAYVYHDFIYRYPLKMDFLEPMYSLYKLRPDLYPGINFIQYLQSHMGQRIDLLVDKTRDTHQLTVKRHLIRSLGYVEYDQEALVAESSGQMTNRWEITFRHTIQFSCPSFLRIYFPTVIANQLTPSRLIRDIHDQPFQYHHLEGLLKEKSFYRCIQQLHIRKPPILRLPRYEDFVIPRSPITELEMQPIIIAAVLLDESGDATIDLDTDLDGALHPTVLEIIRLHRDKDILTTQGIFHVAFYANDYLCDPEDIDVLTPTQFRLNRSDPMRRYHMVLAEVTSFRTMSQYYHELLYKYRWFFPIIIAQHVNTLESLGYYTQVLEHRTLTLYYKTLMSGCLDVVLRELVIEGHTGVDVFSYASTAYQITEYLAITPSLLTGRHLHYEFVDKAISKGCIPNDNYPLYVKIQGKLPYLKELGGSGYGIGSPLRIFDVHLFTHPG